MPSREGYSKPGAGRSALAYSVAAFMYAQDVVPQMKGKDEMPYAGHGKGCRAQICEKSGAYAV